MADNSEKILARGLWGGGGRERREENRIETIIHWEATDEYDKSSDCRK